MDTLTSLDALLLREGVFSQPIRLVSPPSWIPHIPFAFWIVDALKPAVFVELGTQSGNSYAAFAQAVQALELGTACYAVDTWKGDAQTGFYDESVFSEWSAFHDRHFRGFSRLVRSTFDDARSMLADRAIDLLHIDGLHTYDAIRHDFESWLPKLSARGVVLLHDINVRKGDFGAWRFWEEIRGRYPTFAFLHGHGLGVVGVGTDLPPDVRWLVSQLPQLRRESSRVQQVFATLGGSLQLEWQLTALEKERRELTSRVAELEALARRRAEERRSEAATRAAAKDAHAQRAAELSDQEDQEEEFDVAPDELRAERDRLRETIAELEEERAASEADAAALRVAVATSVREQRAVSQALASVTRELKGVHASRIWRLTAPIRQLGGLGLGPVFQIKGLRPAVAVLRALTRPRRLLELRRVVLSGLFDEQYYRSRYDDVRRSRTPATVHYVMAGAREGRSPHPLFDGTFYLAQHADVRAADANPLLHYARSGRTEQHRDPHPLFSTGYYLKRHPDLVALKTNPLLHYLSSDPNEGASPHPLFDSRFYLDENPDATRDGVHPLVHFVERGGPDGRAPHPLFDAAFYLRQNADVRSAGVNPLVHYLEHVPGEDRDPHPLFDSSFYLDADPGLVRQGINPLAHFVEHGWREGRRPNAVFDPLWYLEMNPDVAAAGWNPLEHFARYGWREGRDPSPEFSTSDYMAAHPDIAALGTNPLHHYLLHGVREGRAVSRSHASARRLPPPKSVTLRVEGTAKPQASLATATIVCVSHVIPWPPRAGNEYRVLRMLEWLVAEGYRVLLLLAPLPTESVSAEQLDVLVARVGNVAVCGRDGNVRYTFASCPDILAELEGRRTPNFANRLGERHQPPRDLELIRMERTYCHDALIDVALHAVDRLDQAVLLTEYIWMTRLLPLVGARVPTIVDTHDMYSTKAEKVLPFGVSDVALSAAEEAARLARADLVLAIQDRERMLMQELVPSTDVITAGIDFAVPHPTSRPEPSTVLIVGSGNEINRVGIRDFLRFAWPAILARVPEATLVVAGHVGRYVQSDVPRVENVGPVDDLTPLYARARVVVNPSAAGTGLKIKTVEALNHGRPIVTWPNGFDGIPDAIRQGMALPGDWFEFADHVVAHLDADASGLDSATLSAVRAFVAPSTAYAALSDRLKQLFARMAQPS